MGDFHRKAIREYSLLTGTRCNCKQSKISSTNDHMKTTWIVVKELSQSRTAKDNIQLHVGNEYLADPNQIANYVNIFFINTRLKIFNQFTSVSTANDFPI